MARQLEESNIRRASGSPKATYSLHSCFPLQIHEKVSVLAIPCPSCSQTLANQSLIDADTVLGEIGISQDSAKLVG